MKISNKIIILLILLNNVVLFGQLKIDLDSGTSMNTQFSFLNDSVEVNKTDSISSFLIGRNAAEQIHSSKNWFFTGIGAGIFFQLHGTVVTSLIAYYDKDYPDNIPLQYDKLGFVNGYADKSRENNRNSAFEGGLVGTGVTVAAIITVYIMGLQAGK